MNRIFFLLLLFCHINQAKSLTCDSQFTPITTVQGVAAQSTMVGQHVLIKGVVTADFRGKDNLSGYFIQGPVGNSNKGSSGLFVHSNDLTFDLKAGDLVALSGTVSEQFEVTQLTQVSKQKICESKVKLPEPVLLSMPLDDFDLERVEGMRVGFAQPVVITDLYQYLKYGEMTVSSDLIMAPTSVKHPGDEARQQALDNQNDQLIIDDGRMSEFPVPIAVGADGLTPINVNNGLNLGQSLKVVGVMHFAFGKYKLQPTEAIIFKNNHYEVQHQPQNTGGNFKAGSFNLENYFVTIDNELEECGPLKNFGCRGADSAEEYQRQLAKLTKVINTADAGVMGLQELENNTESIKSLVKALNAAAGNNKWSYIDTGVLGGDVIKVGIIFQPDRVTPIGKYALLNAKTNPEFQENKHRIAVMQTFKTKNDQKFNFATAHFKSKSCRDAEGLNLDQKDGQGCYTPARVEVAHQIALWLNSNPTKQDALKTLFVGDLNSYQKEDPIETLRKAGFSNLAEKYLGPNNWTTSYRGQVGSLDYVLANQAAEAVSTGLTQWHINSIQMHEFGYDLEPLSEAFSKPSNFYQDSPYASSDHDVVVAGFEL